MRSMPDGIQRLNTHDWVMKRDGHTCQVGGSQHGRPIHVDHIWPRALGGTNDLVNLWTLCATCNLSKGPMHPMEWLPRVVESPRIENMEHPPSRFWVLLANACYHAETLGLWLSPDLDRWDTEDWAGS